MFGSPQIIDDSFASGHAIDDVLAALGKHRADAVAVFRLSSNDSVDIGGLWVDGVDPGSVADTASDHWMQPAVIQRSKVDVHGHSGWQLDERDGGVTIIYPTSFAVYFVSAANTSNLQTVLAAMP